MTLTIPLSFTITAIQFDNPRQLQWNLWMDRHKEPYTTCSVCTFVPTLTLDQISVIVQVYNLFALPAMPISWSGRWGETRRDTKTLVGLPEQTQIMPNVVHPLQTVHGQWRCDVGLTRIFSEMSDDFANLCKCIARYFCQPVKYFYRLTCPVRTLPVCWRSTRRKRPRRFWERLGGISARYVAKSSRDGKNIKHFWCHFWVAVIVLGVLRYFKKYFLADLSRFFIISVLIFLCQNVVDGKIYYFPCLEKMHDFTWPDNTK